MHNDTSGAYLSERLAETLLALFYADREHDGPGLDWRQALDGEVVAINCDLTMPPAAAVQSLTFLADGVRQMAPPNPFDAIRCARAMKQAIEKKGV